MNISPILTLINIHCKIFKNFTHFKSLLQHWKSTKGMEAGECRSDSQKRGILKITGLFHLHVWS